MTNQTKTVKLAGLDIPAIGQGSWGMGEHSSQQDKEVAALQLGVDLGMTLTDTAEMYADGGSEIVVGKAIKNIREKVFLVSKFYPHHAGSKSAVLACENSLRRLNTDYLDLYLLHWRGHIPLSETIEVMEKLKAQGKIKNWGVSNFDTSDMQELWRNAQGDHCQTNQVLYHLGSRGIEYDLLPWCQEHSLPVMVYCPTAQAGSLRNGLLNNPEVVQLAKEKNCSVIQLLLAWCVRSGRVIAIPKSTSEVHVRENAKAGQIVLNTEDLQRLDKVFPPPSHKMRLDVV
ncbi:aldo/keto reductase [Neisseriaceae bacterium PsAf]|nr:aldo/keto reductase [Neisseriaceae bacterium PsAf]